MKILSILKEKITDSVIDKLSNFLGEHPEKISPALHSALPALLGSIVQNTHTEEDAAKLMDVLKDGGHTGDILDDLPNILGDFDKTQLLTSIGSNISNHFVGSKANGMIEKLSALFGIRKTSSASLFGLSAPLVLGTIGKVVDREGLGVSGLLGLIKDQKEDVMASLPPALASHLQTTTIEPQQKPTPSTASSSPKSAQKDTNSNWWIPLLLLSLIGLAIFSYWWKNKKRNELPENPVADTTAIAKDTIKIAEVKPLEKEEPAAPEQKPAVEPTTTVEETPAKSTESVATTTGSLSDKLSTTGTWIALGNTDFGKNSAELKKKGDLDEVVRFLKNNRKAKVEIAGGSESGGRLAEDRAYAIWGYLLEKGVRESQIQVSTSQQKGIDGKVGIKVLKK